MTLRAYIENAAVFILASAFALYTAHERRVGEDRVHVADAKAEQEARKNAEAETKLNSERATKADEQAAVAQQAIDSYRADHPEQPVRVCTDTHGGVHLSSQAGPTVATSAGASAGPAPVPAVLGGDQSQNGPNVSADTDALMSAIARLGVLYQDLQRREVR